MNELEKLDIIRSRFKVSYEDARHALAAANGDVIESLVMLEKNPPEPEGLDLLALGAELVDEVQKLVADGSVKKLKFKYGNRLIAEKPVALTAMAAVAVGLAAILISRLVIEVEKSEEEATSEGH